MLVLVLCAPLAAQADPPPLSARMHASWAQATEARDRVIAGDLEGARAAGRALADAGPDSELPEAWRPAAAAITAKATALGSASTLAEAATAVGEIGATCGECHRATGGGPDLEGEDIPPQRWSAGENMRLHAWGSQWMWLGLVSGADSAWDRGGISFDEQPLDLRWDEKPPADGRQQLEELVYVLAGRAVDVTELPERGELYGQLVATCAQCHVKDAPAAVEAPVEEPTAEEPTKGKKKKKKK